MTEPTEEEVEIAGTGAQEVLESEAFQKALKVVKENTIEAWQKGQTTEDREAAHAKIVLLDDIVEELGKASHRGQLSRKIRERDVRLHRRGPGAVEG